MRAPTLIALSLITAFSGGCDLLDYLKPKVSQDKLEEALVDWLKSHDMEAHDVHCPGDAPLEKGHKFECTASVHGTDIPISVEVTDVDSGTVEWEPKYLTLKRGDVEAEILAKPTFAGHDIQLDCHDPVWVSIPDSEWKCDITYSDDGSKHLVVIKFTDGDGTHDMTVDPV